jgi:hypothetical protein
MNGSLDLGLCYSEARPFSIQRLRQLAEEINDTPGPVVTDFYEWGPWVNGGAWLTISGQRVDFLYRSLEHVERVITDAEAGRYEVHYLQQPPFGFFSGTYLGEVAVCIPLFDPDARIEALKRRVAVYPDLLRQKVIRDYLFMAEFTLTVFSPKVAARSDTYGTAACLTRAVNELVLALFALNRKYPINDKTFWRRLPNLRSRHGTSKGVCSRHSATWVLLLANSQPLSSPSRACSRKPSFWRTASTSHAAHCRNDKVLAASRACVAD